MLHLALHAFQVPSHIWREQLPNYAIYGEVWLQALRCKGLTSKECLCAQPGTGRADVVPGVAQDCRLYASSAISAESLRYALCKDPDKSAKYPACIDPVPHGMYWLE